MAIPEDTPDDTVERLVTPPAAPAPSFVGRDQAMSELNAAIVASLQGRGSLVLIAGEPGIGKTRLMAEFSALARRAGVTALWANCWEGGEAPVFWPWIQALRAYGRERDPEQVLRGLGPAASELELLLPERRGRAATAPAATPADARFGLFDAVSSFFRRASQAAPLLLAIDNLHAADEASLQLLRFLAADLAGARVLLLGSYRESEAGSDTLLWRWLGDLGASVQRVQLTGLEPDDVGQLIREYGAAPPDPALSRALHARTQGNPFFVREVLRLLGTGPAALDGVPTSVAQVIDRRLSRLGDAPLSLLRRASALGAEFTLPLLSEVSGVPEREIHAFLPALSSSRLLAREQRSEKYRFAHALVREVCYGQLDDPLRRELHRAAGRAIERRDQVGEHAAEVAFHYVRAGSPDDLSRAVANSEQAARAARRLGAHADAATHLTRALGLLSQQDGDDDRRRCELLLELGPAQMANGALVDAQHSFERAARLARALGSPELLARAALGFGVEFGAGGSNEREVALLEAALAAQPETDAPLRARLMSRLSRALLFGVRHEERAALAEQALELARRLGDPATLANVLYERHQSLWTGAPAEARCAIADEIVQLAEESGDRALALQARALRLGDLLELAELDRFRAECAIYARRLDEARMLSSAWHVPMQRATLAMLAGEWDSAERLGAEGLHLGRRIAHQGIEVFHHSVLMTIRYLQGRHAELLPVLRHGAGAYPTLPVFRAGLALAHTERGERLDASLVFDRLAEDEFRAVPRDILWVFNLALLSITAHFLGDARRAEQLYGWLAPYARYNVRVTRIGVSSIGSTEHYLGLLAATLGRREAAIGHFERAVASHTRQGALAMLANSLLQLARASTDPQRAGAARQRAHEIARALGIRLLLAELDGEPERGGAIVLRRDGPDWTLERGGRTSRFRNAVGMEMLARLLAEPGRDFAALELRGGDRPAGHSDAGTLLDAQAKIAYRERITELRGALEHAEARSDLGRAERARDELERLERELRRAVGLGGRERRALSTHERARISVTKAIRAAVRRIAEHDRELGAHLERSVRTGQVCSFQPDPTANLRWDVACE